MTQPINYIIYEFIYDITSPLWLYNSYLPSDMQIYYQLGRLEQFLYQPSSMDTSICRLVYPTSIWCRPDIWRAHPFLVISVGRSHTCMLTISTYNQNVAEGGVDTPEDSNKTHFYTRGILTWLYRVKLTLGNSNIDFCNTIVYSSRGMHVIVATPLKHV